MQAIWLKTAYMKKYFLLTVSILFFQYLHAQDPAYSAAPANPQNILAAEYFIDADPGVGLANTVAITAAVTISNINFSASTTGLTTGFHRMFLRTKNTEGSWAITATADFLYNLDPLYETGVVPQNITKAEYFIDVNTAFSSGSNIPLTGAVDISNQPATINVSGLTNGVHQLLIRSQTANGIWSITGTTDFLVNLDPPYPAIPAAPANIVKAEYVMDSNTPFGSGTNIPITASTNINNVVFNADVSGLSDNTHYFQLRTLNAEGHWTVTAVKDLIIFLDANPPYPTPPQPAANIVKAEYVMDSNIPFGSGTSIPFAAGTNINNVIFNADVTGLSDNTHYLQLRSLSAEGHWSVTAVKDFIIFLDANPPYPATPPAAANIVKAEYVLDNDIPFGSGTNIPITANTDISTVFSASVSGLSDNTHYLQLRTLNAEGKWAVTNVRDFIIFLNADPQYPDAPLPIGNIVRAEYFLDADPGFGNGLPVTITPGINLNNINFSVNTTSISDGNHRLFLRALDDWSISSSEIFMKGSVVPLKFISFSAQNRDLHVDLDWKTGDETNTSLMTIERSADGVLFQSLGKLPAFNTGGEHQYFFRDAQPLKGMAWYRIVETDLNAHQFFSKTILVNRRGKSQEFIIFPNPVKNSTVLTFTEATAPGKLKLTDEKGSVLLSWEIAAGLNNLSVDLRALPSGLYFLTLTEGTYTLTKQLLKQ
ncbi:MAG: type sorting protein [Ferruginibacter sp.]|nr:type sorting protein [Ferruginibacter sp.]